MTTPTTRERRRLAHRDNRERQRGGQHLGREEWRGSPATAYMLARLRRIASETGHTFDPETITRGRAWLRIKAATTVLDKSEIARCAPPWWTPPATFGSRFKRGGAK